MTERTEVEKQMELGDDRLSFLRIQTFFAGSGLVDSGCYTTYDSSD